MVTNIAVVKVQADRAEKSICVETKHVNAKLEP